MRGSCFHGWGRNNKVNNEIHNREGRLFKNSYLYDSFMVTSRVIWT